jgi:hypothetical protein
MTLYDELGKVLKLKRKGDESFDSFTARTAKKINALEDPDWKELTEGLQVWHNNTMKAREEGGDDIDEATLPKLEGWPGAEAEAAGEAPEEEEGEEESGEDTANDNAEEDVDAAADSEQEGDNEAAEAAASAKKSARKKVAAPAEKSKPEKSTKSTPKVKEKEIMPAKKTVTKVVVAKKVATASARTRIGDADTIKLLAKTNPYREGSLGAKVFAKYKDGMKVKQFTDGVAKLDTSRPAAALLRYDIAKGYVKVQSAA